MRKGKLTRTQLVQHIRNIMPEGLSELEIAAVIEKQIADNVVFDEGYLWSDHETRKKIYKLAKQEAQKPKEEIKRKIICINMAELYVYVARQFGLDAEFQRTTVKERKIDETEIGGSEIFDKISEHKLDHVCPILNLKDGKRIKVDIQSDLKNLQTRSKPIDFGQDDDRQMLSTLSDEEITSIFKKVYRLQDGETFTDEYIANLTNELNREQLEPMEKIKRIMEDNRVQEEVKQLGITEVKEFYKDILGQVLGIPIFGIYFRNCTRAHISTCSISDGKGKTKHSVFLYMQDFDNQICYIFSKKNRKMVSVTPEELYQMEAQSMIIRPAYTPEDRNMQTDIIENSMNSFIKKGKNSIQAQQEIDMDEFFEEEEEK